LSGFPRDDEVFAVLKRMDVQLGRAG
jgi:hypothetical protein